MNGSKLKIFRKDSGMSQLDLEIEIGASSGSISRIENNSTNPTKETLYKIAKALNLDNFQLAELMGIEFDYSDKHIPHKLLTQEITKGITLRNIIKGEYDKYSLQVGKDNYIKECDSTLDHPESEILFLQNIDSWRKVYSEEEADSKHVPRRIQGGMFAKFLLNGSDTAVSFKNEDHGKYRETRILHDLGNFEFTLMITKKQLTVFHSHIHASAFSIQEPHIASKAREVFQTIWSQSN